MQIKNNKSQSINDEVQHKKKNLQTYKNNKSKKNVD